jgi:polyisoprenoid-binding protein YceI
MTSRALLLAAAFLLAVSGAPPAPAQEEESPRAAIAGRTFWFGTHEARTTVTFTSEAEIETIHGVSHSMSGSLAVSEDGNRASGTLRVPVAAMRTGIDLRDEHLRSDQWLDAARHPSVTLELVSARLAKDGRTWEYDARLTVKGTTRDLAGSAQVTVVPEALNAQLGPGRWVRVRTGFDVPIRKFGIEIPESVVAKVSEVWKVRIDVYGTTAAPTPEAE